MEAESLFKRALRIWEEGDDSTAIDKATTLNNLGAVYQYQSRYAEAEPDYRQGLALLEKIRGPEHPDVGNALINLAVAYAEEDKFPDAERTFSDVLTILAKQPRPNALTLAMVHTSMSNLYRRKGKQKKARGMAQKVKTIRDLEESPT
jgi:tetratricopeptide (TPR) repeat protein